MKILITGGAGFVGSSLAFAFKDADAGAQIVAFDNLRRRGSELNLAQFKKRGIAFAHGDVRNPNDLTDIEGQFDLMIDASAEPSVLAGVDGSPSYVLQTNLQGTLNCLEALRSKMGALIFLSTSRVYSLKPLRELALDETPQRFEISKIQAPAGVSKNGVAEHFPTHLPRSFYGASKLASELIIQEYCDTLGLRAVINRCGVIAGPGQFGKVDQGVFTLWVANHYFGKPLKYTGFGGQGKQVRDLLHPRDLFELLQKQLGEVLRWKGEVYNVGGGAAHSTSLAELTAVCREVTARNVPIASDGTTSAMDVPLYISDCAKVAEHFQWQPKTSVRDIVTGIHAWIRTNEAALTPIFA